MTGQISDLAWQAAATHRRLQQSAKSLGLEPAEWGVLCYLASSPGSPSADLREHLALQAGSLSNALGALRTRGLVVTQGSGTDQRYKAHWLTEDGERTVGILVEAFKPTLDAGGHRTGA